VERGIGVAAFNLGRLLEGQGRTKEAEEAFAKEAELEGDERPEIEASDSEEEEEDGWR
jgi:hypothetical protein